MAHPDLTLEYTSPSADSASFSATNPIRWFQAYGAGTVVLLDNSATPASRTYIMSGGDERVGEWTALVSTSCSRIVVGTTATQRPAVPPLASGVIPAPNLQGYANGGAALTAAFTAAIGTVYLINPSGATFAYTLPAITAGNDGQKIAIVNVSTGSTATVAAPTGANNVGNCAGTATGATAAGPTGGNVKTYTANNQTGAWLVGI